MTFTDYQNQTHRTNLYPPDMMLECLTLGICSEAGEIADKVKKFHRGDKGVQSEAGLRLLLVAELGDALYYISELANYLEISLDDIAVYNLAKLQDRAERGMIRGSGDER
jgi:NTP pyrophosphatase (non-canonical NTP hydrolase)